MKKLMTVVCALLVSSMVAAGSSRPEMVKALDRVDLAGRSITLGGQTYRLAEEVRWIGFGERRPADALPLMQGRRMGIVVDYIGGSKMVTEVWVQP